MWQSVTNTTCLFCSSRENTYPSLINTGKMHRIQAETKQSSSRLMVAVATAFQKINATKSKKF